MANLDNHIDDLKKHNTLSVDLAVDLTNEGIFPQDLDSSRGSVEDLIEPYVNEPEVNRYEGLTIQAEGEELKMLPEDFPEFENEFENDLENEGHWLSS